MEISAINLGTDSVITAIPNASSANNASSASKKAEQAQPDTSNNAQAEKTQKEQLEKIVNTVNETLACHRIRFEYSIHDKTKAIMVKMVNADTGEVIREIPPKKFLDIEAMTLEQAGLLIDKRA